MDIETKGIDEIEGWENEIIWEEKWIVNEIYSGI